MPRNRPPRAMPPLPYPISDNSSSYLTYFYQLKEMAINRWKWKNLPDTVDERFIELILFEYGKVLFFNEPDIGYLALTCWTGGTWDIYRNPILRQAYATNGFQARRDNKDSVIIYNNYLRQPTMLYINEFAKRLTNIQRTIDINLHAQKTPITISCDEDQRLSYLNAYKNYNGNTPVILGDKSFNLDGIKVLNTGAPYLVGDLQKAFSFEWNRALTFLGIENSGEEKKERKITGEIESNLGDVFANRKIELKARKQACEMINRMFGLDIDVEFDSMFLENYLDDGTVEENE